MTDEDAFAVAVHSAGCGIGGLARGGLAWGCQSATRILSAGVIGGSKQLIGSVLEEIRAKTSLVLHIPLRVAGALNWNKAAQSRVVRRAGGQLIQ